MYSNIEVIKNIKLKSVVVHKNQEGGGSSTPTIVQGAGIYKQMHTESGNVI